MSSPAAPADAFAVAVCDGVSTSGDPPTRPPMAASKAGVDAMLNALAADVRSGIRRAGGSGRGGEGGGGRGVDTSTQSIAPSCTYTAAAVRPDLGWTRCEIAVGNVGDSRAYWIPEPPAPRAIA